MNSISVEPQALRTVADQLRTIASYLEKLIPVEPDAHLPAHRRLEYVTRSRSFGDAFTSKAKKKGGR
jgi:hypothetical protein